jgi:integrase
MSKITVRSLDAFKGRPGQRLNCSPNLFLAVSRSGGGKHFVFRATFNGRVREMGLGSYPTVTLAMARAKAADLRREIASGVDPLQSKRQARVEAQRQAATFKAALDAYVAAPIARGKPQTIVLVDRLNRHAAALFAQPLASLDTQSIARALARVNLTNPVTARRALNDVARVLDHARVMGLVRGDNPATFKSNFAFIWDAPPPTTHLRAVPHADVPRVYSDLIDLDNVASWCLRFAILTAARTSMALYATHDEIDVSARTWNVAAGRMKMKGRDDFVVPLCDEALAIVAEMRERRVHWTSNERELIFPASHGGKMHDRALSHVLQRTLGVAASVHGFRSSFSTWANDETGFDPLVIEAALAHEETNKVRKAYDRGSKLAKRRALMTAWQDHVLGRTVNANVVPFAGVAR